MDSSMDSKSKPQDVKKFNQVFPSNPLIRGSLNEEINDGNG